MKSKKKRYQVICFLSFFGLNFFSLKPCLAFTQEKTFIPATKVVPLSEVMKPRFISVGHERIYVLETEMSLSVFSTDDFRFLKKFSRKGQGPGEMHGFLPLLSVSEDGVVINDLNKIMFFSPDGEFKNQLKILINFHYAPNHPFLPVDGRFVGFLAERIEPGKHIRRGQILDSEFKLIKPFYDPVPSTFPPPGPPPPPESGKKMDIEVFVDQTFSAVENGRILVADSRKGFHVSVFDKNGDLLYEIHKNLPQLKVTKEYKETYIEGRDPRIYNFKFRENFPAFFGFKIDDGNIYMVTYKEKDAKNEIIFMNYKGDIIRRSFIFPPQSLMYSPFSSRLYINNCYDIYKNRIYYLHYNDKDDIFELHVVEIME